MTTFADLTVDLFLDIIGKPEKDFAYLYIGFIVIHSLETLFFRRFVDTGERTSPRREEGSLLSPLSFSISTGFSERKI